MEYQFESIGPILRIIALVFMIIFALVLLAFVVVLAALPGKIAKDRNHPQSKAVNVCGWVGPPTGILWAVALVWAFWVDNSSSDASAACYGKLSQQLDRLGQSLDRLEAKNERKSIDDPRDS